MQAKQKQNKLINSVKLTSESEGPRSVLGLQWCTLFGYE